MSNKPDMEWFMEEIYELREQMKAIDLRIAGLEFCFEIVEDKNVNA